MKKISILLPAYNEEESIDYLYNKMIDVAKVNAQYQWEFLLVNDGSSDNTLDEIIKLHDKDNRFSYLDLSRNYGKEIAMMAGFDYVTGDAVIIMDSDMQHPTSIIPQMLKYWEEGYQDVYAQRKSSKESWFKKESSKLYYKILSSVSPISILQNVGDFRLLDSVCVKALRKMRETQRNTKSMYCWIGYKKKGILYDQLDRKTGKTKWNFFSLLNLAIDGITSCTTIPLRFSTFLGLITSLLAFVYLIYIIISTNLFGEPVQGFPTLMVTILFFSGVQLLSLGIIGEYLSRIFNESKHRPGYFINSYNGKQCEKDEKE